MSSDNVWREPGALDKMMGAAKQVLFERMTPRERSAAVLADANHVLVKAILSGKELDHVFIGDNEITVKFAAKPAGAAEPTPGPAPAK